MTEEPQRYWSSAEPKDAYDVVIVGGGGHGLATAYYLARNHDITDVCIVEKGWLAGGNVARNTTVIRSNYLWDASAAIYEHSLQLWEGLEEDLGWDLQFDQKGVLNILHHIGEVRNSTRRVEANHLQGVDAEMLDAQQVQGVLPDHRHLPRRPVPGARRRAAAAGWDRSSRPGGMGTRDPRERSRRRHRRARRGNGVPARRRRCGDRRRDDARPDPREQGRARRGRPHERAGLDGRTPAAGPVASAAGAGERAVRAGPQLRRDVERGPRLRVAGRQGRARDGRRHRQLQRLRAARVVPRDRAPDGRGVRALPDVQARGAAAHVGRDRRRLSRRVADHRRNAGPGPLPQLRLGHRRVQGHARQRLGLRGDHRHRRTERAREALCAGALHNGRA